MSPGNESFLIYIPNGPLKGYVYQMAGAETLWHFNQQKKKW